MSNPEYTPLPLTVPVGIYHQNDMHVLTVQKAASLAFKQGKLDIAFALLDTTGAIAAYIEQHSLTRTQYLNMLAGINE